MVKSVNGYCPTQNCNYTIHIDIVSTATLDNPSAYEIGMMDCQYSILNKCDISRYCPILTSVK